MPLSTGSIDSGFFGCTADDSLKKGGSDDRHKSSPLSMTDEEETSSTSSSGFSQNSAPNGDSSLTPSSIPSSIFLTTNSGLLSRKPRTRVRRSNRKLKRLPHIMNSRFDSITSLPGFSTGSAENSSCCLSIAGSSRSSVSSSSSSVNASIDELALRLYFYFKSLLIAVNKQKTICENIAYLVRDFDARWGNSGVRKKTCDPKGCLAPIYSKNRDITKLDQELVTPAKFPLCWAVPQPAIFYQLMATDVLEYIKFLERVSPQVKSQQQPSGPAIQNEREASMTIETMKMLQFQQQQWQQQLARNGGVYFPQFMYLDNQMRLKQQSQHPNLNLQRVPSFDGEPSSPGKETRQRDSSNDSRGSSDADPNSIPFIMDKLDNELTGADLDKTPTVEKGQRKSRKNDSKSWRKDQLVLNG